MINYLKKHSLIPILEYCFLTRGDTLRLYFSLFYAVICVFILAAGRNAVLSLFSLLILFKEGIHNDLLVRVCVRVCVSDSHIGLQCGLLE